MKVLRVCFNPAQNSYWIKVMLMRMNGDTLQVDIDGATDAIRIKFFSDETLKESYQGSTSLSR
jgi:hypothetical protein